MSKGVYVSNETNTNVEFDNLQIDHQSNCLIETNDYYPYGLLLPRSTALDVSPQDYKYNGKELQRDLQFNVEDYGARQYDPVVGRWLQVDPLAHMFPHQSPYTAFDNNPILNVDPDGRAAVSSAGDNDDWVEGADGKINWDENATSPATTKEGEKYLGKNVLVGTHNRDAKLNEPINTAKFELYLESNKEGPSATIMGNTVPADNKASSTLAEGLYPAKSQGRDKYLRKGKEDLALIINRGLSVPTAPGSPKSSMSEIFFHSGNNYQKSLFDSNKNPYSTGCQSSGCGPGSYSTHKSFMNAVGTGFKGSYYLRSQPKLEVPKSQ